MSLNLKDAKKSGGERALAPAGNHVARCYSIVDLGSHTADGKYGVRTERKIRITWELPEEQHTFQQERGPEPFAVHTTINFTIGPKSRLLKLLESWKGKALSDAELDNFELKSLLGKTCMVNVTHQTVGDNTFANVDSVAPVPKKMEVPSPVNQQIYYEIDMGKSDVFKSLPDWMKEMINKCNEWKSDPPAGSDSPPDDIFEDETDDSKPF